MLFTSGTQKLQERTVPGVRDNVFIAAFRDYPEHSAQVAENWQDALEDPSTEFVEIRTIIIDSLGSPLGPGWEDQYYILMLGMTDHALKVLNRFARIYG